MPTEMSPKAPTILYSHRPKPFAAELELELTAHELIATRGRSIQRFPLTAIERVVLRFSPRNTAHRAFACTVRATDGKSVTFDSLSWKSLIETEKQNDSYARFVTTLCERAERARAEVELVAGVPPWKFWGMLVAGIGTLAGLLAIAGYSVSDKSWFAAGLAVALFGYLGFWMRDYLTRNRPARFRSGAMPSLVLP
ncbi:MAG: hypothetical protein MUF11_00130 [Beijerinckiaceae bacterium]|jgi:hypothetical protein|nr:hypothetical protein [Beijerinckiaceae bacterium]